MIKFYCSFDMPEAGFDVKRKTMCVEGVIPDADVEHVLRSPEVSQGKIFDQAQIARAVELGLGVESPDEIELVTADTDTESRAYADQIKAMLMA